ncbi:hypothetical protein AVEN_28386-1 [Araneus ventricosus]|uniref:Uncharacterized protein n=1 Tax=Araneus ventricosus TaxID=182803 RepID=A0A4Y2JLN6_ARAVE|nr:hypothetical protein AVEN_28386-1 [Araneus ventricosus]
MTVTGFSYYRKTKVWILKVRINSIYNQEHILSPNFKYKTPSLNPQCHLSKELHEDKASSHTSQSTVSFLQKIEQEISIKTVPFADIPAKSPDALIHGYLCF